MVIGKGDGYGIKCKEKVAKEAKDGEKERTGSEWGGYLPSGRAALLIASNLAGLVPNWRRSNGSELIGNGAGNVRTQRMSALGR